MGFGLVTIWQLIYVLPNWESQVGGPKRISGVSWATAIFELTLSGLIFIWHYYNMTQMFASSGAVAVGLVNAVR